MVGNEDALERRFKLFVDGESLPAETGETIPVEDPSTESTFATVAAGAAADVDRAVAAARNRQRSWEHTRPVERGRILHRAADRLRENRAELARLLTRENGKPLSQARSEIDVGARYFEYYAGAADKVHGETVPLGPDYVDYTVREPLGVTGHVVPWNFPVSLFARTVAPALATGNAVVVKPAEDTPLTAIELGSHLDAAGVPPGAVNVVPGYGTEAGAALTGHDDVDGVAFTGSVETGKEVAATAAGSLTPVHIEAGGKNPNVVFPDADLERAVEQTLISIFTRNAGQVCSAGDRLLLHEDVREPFLDSLLERAAQLTVGPGVDGPDLGPVVSEAQYETVHEYVRIGVEEAGDPILGGNSPGDDRDGYFVAPTIFDGVTPDMRIAREEIFGPVLTVATFSDENEAIELANDSEYGLVAGIFTRDLDRAHRFARDVVAGQVYVNEWFAGGVETPFGGYRQSGFGREKGLEAVRTFTETKNVCVNVGTDETDDRR